MTRRPRIHGLLLAGVGVLVLAAPAISLAGETGVTTTTGPAPETTTPAPAPEAPVVTTAPPAAPSGSTAPAPAPASPTAPQVAATPQVRAQQSQGSTVGA